MEKDEEEKIVKYNREKAQKEAEYISEQKSFYYYIYTLKIHSYSKYIIIQTNKRRKRKRCQTS